MAAIDRLVMILATTVPAFFVREKPISRPAKPACMKSTRIAATTTHMVLRGTVSGSVPSTALREIVGGCEQG